MVQTTPLEIPDIPNTAFLRLPQVLKMIPVGKSTWWAGVKSGRYPQAYKLGPRTTAWKAEDILKLIAEIEAGNHV
ncbi:MAG: prophage regulatory protein [Oceanicoccus sp.]|jgi:prophage regulatory protein